MGDVFLAIRGQPGMEKLCVVKRLMPDVRANSEHRARFQREAMLVRRLSHGAIAQTLAVNEVAGELVIVQEFIDGRNLTQVLAACVAARDWPPVPLVVHIVREVARALAYAHRLDGKGVMHRDVAPDNIMLAFDGEVKLVDFGIARAASDPSLTAPGLVVGRRSYTAPEIQNGAVGDRRSDLYSLGVVLWQLLAGRSLPLLETAPVPPPPSSVRPFGRIPAALDAGSLRAIARRPEDRFQTGEEVQQALGAFLPTTFVGEQAVAEFLQQHYDIALERRRMNQDLEDARQLLVGASAFSIINIQALPSPSRRPKRLLRIGVAAFATLLSGGMIYWALRPPAPGPISSSPIVQPTSLLPPARKEASRPRADLPEPIPTPVLPREGVRASHLSKNTFKKRSQPSQKAVARTLRADALLESAGASFGSGDFVTAERLAREAIRLGTSAEKARAHVILGQVLERVEDPAAAEREFESALILDPTNASAADRLVALRHHRRGGE